MDFPRFREFDEWWKARSTVAKVQWGISIAALTLAASHILLPFINVDWIVLILFAIAIAPWLVPIVKSFELPGGLKVELRELEDLEQRARGAGLLETKDGMDVGDFAFQLVADRDPNLALAGLRIEIEKRLRTIAMPWVPKGKPVGLSWLMRELQKREALSQQQVSVLSDLIGLLNNAVHGAEVDPKSLDWAMNVGPLLVYSLEEVADDQEVDKL